MKGVAFRKAAGLFSLFIIATLFYFSIVRFASQLVITTDESSLWISDLESGSKLNPNMLRTLAALDPFSADYRYLLARRAMATDMPQARAALNSALRVSLTDPKLWVLSAWMEGRSGRFAEALKNFENSILLDPWRPDSYAQQGVFIIGMFPFLETAERPFYLTRAEENILFAKKLDPRTTTEPSVALALSFIYREKGENAMALNTIRKITDIDGADLAFLMRKWTLQFELGDAKEAVADWNRLFIPNSYLTANLDSLEKEIRKQKIPDFRYFLAEILRWKGDKQGALSELIALTSLKALVPEYRLALASLYEETGDGQAALKAYEEVLEMSPSNEPAKRKIIEYYKAIQPRPSRVRQKINLTNREKSV